MTKGLYAKNQHGWSSLGEPIDFSKHRRVTPLLTRPRLQAGYRDIINHRKLSTREFQGWAQSEIKVGSSWRSQMNFG